MAGLHYSMKSCRVTGDSAIECSTPRQINVEEMVLPGAKIKKERQKKIDTPRFVNGYLTYLENAQISIINIHKS